MVDNFCLKVWIHSKVEPIPNKKVQTITYDNFCLSDDQKAWKIVYVWILFVSANGDINTLEVNLLTIAECAFSGNGLRPNVVRNSFCIRNVDIDEVFQSSTKTLYCYWIYVMLLFFYLCHFQYWLSMYAKFPFQVSIVLSTQF